MIITVQVLSNNKSILQYTLSFYIRIVNIFLIGCLLFSVFFVRFPVKKRRQSCVRKNSLLFQVFCGIIILYCLKRFMFGAIKTAYRTSFSDIFVGGKESPNGEKVSPCTKDLIALTVHAPMYPAGRAARPTVALTLSRTILQIFLMMLNSTASRSPYV